MLRREIPSIIRTMTTHDRSQLHYTAGARNALGVALPLVVGLLIHQVPAAIVVTLGALVTGFAGITGTSRLRLRTMGLAIIWLTLTTGIGALSGNSFFLSVFISMISGLFAGLMVAVSPAAAQVGVLATQSMIIFMAFPAAPLQALYQALLVTLGGLLQMALMWAHDRLTPMTAEGQSVRQVFAAVRAFVPVRTRSAERAVVQALVNAETQLNDSRLPDSEWTRWRRLLDLIEQVRNGVVALSLSRRLTEVHPVCEPRENADLWQAFYRALVDVLGPLTTQVSARATVQLMQETEETTLATAVKAVHEHALKVTEHIPTWQRIDRQAAQLGEVIADIKETLQQGPATHLRLREHSPTHSFWQPIFTLLSTVRANLTWKSAAWRHALRVAVTLGAAVALYRAIPLARGYWVPMTALLILKPDFFSTVGRGLSRMLGTTIGVIFATALVALPDPSHVLSIVWMILFAALMFTVVNYNYTLFAICITSEIVVLLSFFEHMAPLLAARDRLEDTLLGSALALIAFSVWPTWQRINVPAALANFLQANGRYLQTLLFPKPDQPPALARAEARKRIRLARTNAVAVVEQMLSEPVDGPLDHPSVIGFLTAMHRFVDGLLALEASLDPAQITPAQMAPIDQLCQEVWHPLDQALAHLEDIVRHSLSDDANANAKLAAVLDQIAAFPPEEFAIHWPDDYQRRVLQRLRGNIVTMARLLPLDQITD